jgi:CoA:oxalate CoA-transferase
MVLKELGAEVIKVEIPGGGDGVRNIPPITQGGESYIFVNINRGKKSITLNLNTQRGQEIARELVKKVDVVVENFTPGVMDRLGLGYEELKKVNPGLIYASLSGFGHTGPRRLQPAYDTVAQAMGGFMSVTGFPDNPPTKAGPGLADFVSPLYTTISILAALRHREKGGKGQHIDISMQDCIWAITAVQFAAIYFHTGEVPPRVGNRQLEATPFGTFPAKDGYVVIAVVTVGQWENFLRVIGREDLIGVEEYVTQVERLKRWQEVDAMIEEWTKTRSVKEIVETLNNAHLPCSPVPTFDEVANDPQLLSRGMVVEVEQLLSGNLKVPGSVFKLSETPGEAKYSAPFLGEHNYEIFRDLLGYGEAEINKLAQEGII